MWDGAGPGQSGRGVLGVVVAPSGPRRGAFGALGSHRRADSLRVRPLTRTPGCKVIASGTHRRGTGPICEGSSSPERHTDDGSSRTSLGYPGDWSGKLLSDRERPSDFSERAEELSDRHGRVWWEPPPDCKPGSEAYQNVRERVVGYLREDWDFVGVVVEVKQPACPCCGHEKVTDASLWGIESDAGDYFANVIDDLLTEAKP